MPNVYDLDVAAVGLAEFEGEDIKGNVSGKVAYGGLYIPNQTPMHQVSGNIQGILAHKNLEFSSGVSCIKNIDNTITDENGSHNTSPSFATYVKIKYNNFLNSKFSPYFKYQYSTNENDLISKQAKRPHGLEIGIDANF